MFCLKILPAGTSISTTERAWCAKRDCPAGVPAYLSCDFVPAAKTQSKGDPGDNESSEIQKKNIRFACAISSQHYSKPGGEYQEINFSNRQRAGTRRVRQNYTKRQNPKETPQSKRRQSNLTNVARPALAARRLTTPLRTTTLLRRLLQWPWRRSRCQLLRYPSATLLPRTTGPTTSTLGFPRSTSAPSPRQTTNPM